MFTIDFVIAVNDQTQLEHNFLRSPDLTMEESVFVYLEENHKSAGKAYTAGLSRGTGRIVVFCHQDVYLPDGWISRLKMVVGQLDHIDPSWGVLGCYGITENDQHAGFVYCNATGKILGKTVNPTPVKSLDELLLVVKRSSGLLFDCRLPSFHLYGSDIVLQAKSKGVGAYVADLFCVHNTRKLSYLPEGFWRSARYLQRKWSGMMPYPTTVGIIPKSTLSLYRWRVKNRLLAIFRPKPVRPRVPDPRILIGID